MRRMHICNTTNSIMAVLCITIQFALLCSLPVWGYRPKTLLVKSAFVKQNSSQLSKKHSIRSFPSLGRSSTYSSDECILKIRGGSYNDYNEGYGYDDQPRKDYNDDYRYNDYEEDNNSYQSSNRYDDDYYQRRSDTSGYYDDEGRYRYDDYDDRGGRSRRKPPSSSSLPTVLTSGNRKLGILFLSSGAAFTALGITLFFNKTLMRLGNLLFVCGIPLMIGPGRTLGYFLQPKKARATGCLVCGIFLVLVGHPVIGILLEIFGLLNLFGNMFPVLLLMARNLPVVGGLFGGDGGSGRRKERVRREEDYYGDRYGEDDGGYGGEREQWQEKY